jgi:hypothetical protein
MPGDITLSTDRMQAVVLSTFRSAYGEAKHQYLSGPVTGGQLFIDWFVAEGRSLPDEVFRHVQTAKVVKPNIDALKNVAEKERSEGRLTIEPGSFEAEFTAWGQPEYYALWDRVIRDHAAVLKFLDGWEYSAGCVFEYDSAIRYGLPACDQRGTSLGIGAALRLIEASLANLNSRLLPTDNDKSRLRKLHNDIDRYRGHIAGRA